MKSELAIPKLFGEVFSILHVQLDFYARVFFSEEGAVEFSFGFEDEELNSYEFFEEGDLEHLAKLLFDTELDTDGQPISTEDQEDYPSGAVTQVTFYRYATLELLTSRNSVLQHKAKAEGLTASTPFEVRVKEFLVTTLGLIHSTSECKHKFVEDDDFSQNCRSCGILIWDPESLSELTDGWY